MVIREACPTRESRWHKKNGHTRHGKQNHQCKACGRQFAADAVDRNIAGEQRLHIEQLLCERVSLRGSCRAVGVSLTWLLHFMIECFAACPDHLHVQPPHAPPQSWCPGWKPKPMRCGVLCNRRRTNNGSGSPWMRLLAKSLRFMWGTEAVRVARSSGPRCRWSTVNRQRVIRTSMKSIKGSCQRSSTVPSQRKLGKPITSSASITRYGSACPVWCVRPSPSPKHSRITSALLNAWCEWSNAPLHRRCPSPIEGSILPRIRSLSMIDTDTFLATLYVMVNDFCKTSLPPESPPGPQAALSRSEIVTLALFGQWQGFGSARRFYRYAHPHLCAAFPTLPSREQFNRHVRQQHEALVACFLHLVQLWAAQRCPYEALDSSGIPRGMPNAVAWAGCQAWPILAGATGRADMKAAICSWRSTPWGCSPASALVLHVPKITPSRRRSLHGAAIPIRAWRAWAPRPAGRTSSTRASRGKPSSRPGGRLMVPRSSARRSAIAERRGPSGSGAGWLGCTRSWRPCMRSFGIPSVWTGSGPMTSAGFRCAWRQRWPSITFVCSSMDNAADHYWPLRTWWTGDLIGSHTKRCSISFVTTISQEEEHYLCRYYACPLVS